MTTPFTTIAVPTLNEEAHIVATLEDLVSSAKGLVECEIIVVDGGSTDRTHQLVEQFGAQAAVSVRLIDNPARIQSAGINLAAANADSRSEILVRADAHCVYPPNFIPEVVKALSQLGVHSVVVPMFTVGEEGTYQEAVALAQNSKLGNGGSAHRAGGTPSGFVDHGHHAAFNLEWFRHLGGYDESFATNEDAEFDARLRNSGGMIWMAREAEIKYVPRGTPAALARQYYRYGRGRCATTLKHRMVPRPRQMAPLAIFLVMLFSVVSLPACGYSALPILGYLMLCLGYALTISGDRMGGGIRAVQVASAFAIMHNAWGAGFVRGLLDHAQKLCGGRKK